MPRKDYFTATSPCPICGRYKTAYKDKCFGFISPAGNAYCSREQTEGHTISRYGKTLYRHSEQLRGIAASNKPISPSAHLSNADSEIAIPKKEKLNQSLTKELQSAQAEAVGLEGRDLGQEMDELIWNRRKEGKWPYAKSDS